MCELFIRCQGGHGVLLVPLSKVEKITRIDSDERYDHVYCESGEDYDVFPEDGSLCWEHAIVDVRDVMRRANNE